MVINKLSLATISSNTENEKNVYKKDEKLVLAVIS